jgi:hypothetical protein
MAKKDDKKTVAKRSAAARLFRAIRKIEPILLNPAFARLTCARRIPLGIAPLVAMHNCSIPFICRGKTA